MTQEELIKEINQLPVEQRKALRDAISQSLQKETLSREPRVSVADKLYGIARPNDPLPSDEELKDDYIRYLTEKYS